MWLLLELLGGADSRVLGVGHLYWYPDLGHGQPVLEVPVTVNVGAITFSPSNPLAVKCTLGDVKVTSHSQISLCHSEWSLFGGGTTHDCVDLGTMPKFILPYAGQSVKSTNACELTSVAGAFVDLHPNKSAPACVACQAQEPSALQAYP